MIEITLTHWAYLAGVLAIVLAMILRRGVVLIATVGLFLIGLLYTGNLVNSIQVVFNSYMSAGTKLFDIMLVIALMVGMLKSMETLGTDEYSRRRFNRVAWRNRCSVYCRQFFSGTW